MSRAFVLFTRQIQLGELKLKGVVTDGEVARQFRRNCSDNDYELADFQEFESDDVELLAFILSRTAGTKYKGPINQPCSACGDGDTAMEYHDHDYVPEDKRRPPTPRRKPR